MKKILFIIMIVFIHNIFSNNIKKDTYGFLFMGGIRYDDVRMCVATEKNVKGGPMADIMLSINTQKDDGYSIVYNIPVMRPVLFLSAFKMVQFEPYAALIKRTKVNDNVSFLYGPGFGISFHYGPDYRSDLNNRNKNFFAAGPILNYHLGLSLNKKYVSDLILNIFYTPLFAENKKYNGNVLGASFQFSKYLF